ncbi:FG-GAP repeat protein [Streptomyces spiramyceticus]|uniref:FG-GAP repeat protein n=1 Tax=Streptomyces spiramyceticus TaxID=299717 RepID=UPI00237AA010|nr:FG-GAP repeat protein [Streptomyces spiramyceticus]
MRTRVLFLTTALAAGLLAAAPAAVAAPLGLGGDFNGDGHRDLAFAAPYATFSGQGMAGYTAVAYGTSAGISTAKYTVVHQNSTGVPGSAEAEDTFGAAFAIADFNGDGYADLAAGAPGEDVGSDGDGGSVTIVWGSATGLNGGTTVKDPAPTAHDEFGRELAAGDFDGDGRADLAVGTSSSYAYVIRGGFTKAGVIGGVQKVGLPDKAKYGIDAIGAGEINADKRSDLVITYRTTTPEGKDWSKGVAYLGSSTAKGVDAASPRPLDGGTSIAVGDINGDGYGEIALGNTFDKSDEHSGSLGGKVVVIRGSQGGPVNGDVPMARLTQSSPGVPGGDEQGDGFGGSVSIADTNGDGYGELAIGVVFEDIGATEDTGSVVVMRGSAAGVSTTGALNLTQSTSGVPGTAEDMDYFGSDVHLSDVTKDGRADLTVTAGFENEGTGAVWTLRSGTVGVSTTGAKSFGPSAVRMPTTYGAFGANLSN